GIEALGHPIGPYRGVLEPIIFGSLLLVPEDAVGFVDLLEAFGLLLVAAGDVGVILLRELPVGFFDRGVVGVLGDAERFVKVFHWMGEGRMTVREIFKTSRKRHENAGFVDHVTTPPPPARRFSS